MEQIGSRTVRMTSDEISQRGFATKVRGLSETDVRSFLKRVGEEVDRLAKREDELLERISGLQSDLEAKPKASKAELLESLGEQTTRVLSSAEEAAEQMLSDAKTASEKIRNDAKKESDQLIIDARNQAEQTISDMQARVRSMQESSNRDSQTVISQARTKGREIFQESVVVREQILKDLLRRRDLLLEQIEELRRGREELLDSYKVVKGSFQKATDALHSVEEKASSELLSNPIDVDELLKSPVELPNILNSGQPIPNSSSETQSAKDVDNIEIHTDKSDLKSDKKYTPTSVAEIATLSTKEKGTDDLEGVSITGKRGGIKNYVKEALGVGEDGSEISPQVSVLSTENETEVSSVETASTVKPDSPKKDVEALFEKLKNQSPDNEVETKDVKEENKTELSASQTPQAKTKSKKKTQKKKTATKSTSAKKDPLVIRDDVLSSVTTAVLRKAKRQLQDEQNELLESLRTIKPKKRIAAENILTDEQTHLKSWEEAIRNDLESVFDAGAATVTTEKQKLEEDLLKSMVNWIVAPLRETLIMAIDEGEQADATSRVGARYREWRNADLKNALYDALCSAYNNGVVQAAKNDVMMKWNVEKAGQCPDCDDNALEPTSAREAFPTGQVAPPAHSGCRCVITVA